MPSLVVANAALLRLIWSNGGVPYMVNVLGVHNPTSVPITQAMANALGTAIKGSFGTSGLGVQCGILMGLQTVGIRSIAAPNQPEYLDTGGTTAGTGAGDQLPPQTALCVTLRTALAGRRYRGRVYLGGFVESANQAGGTILAATSTAAKAFVDAINTALAGQSLALAVVSRPNPAAVPVWAGVASPVTATIVRDQVWDTQRRRATAGI